MKIHRLEVKLIIFVREWSVGSCKVDVHVQVFDISNSGVISKEDFTEDEIVAHSVGW